MQVSYQKKRLLFSVAGLDRGFAANAAAELAVETAIYSLVGAAGGSPPLTWTSSALISPASAENDFYVSLDSLGLAWILTGSAHCMTPKMGMLEE